MAKMVDLEYDDEDIADMPMPFDLKVKKRYPWNTKFSLTDKELRKMDVDVADYDKDDLIDMRCFGKIVGKSEDENGCRLEIQIERIAVENEDRETVGKMGQED